MKRVICALFIFFSWLNIFAINTSELNDSATSYYLESDFENALKIYNSLLEEKYISAELYYNIGNCYYKLNDIPNAIYYYEKAKLLAPKDSDLNHNLEFVNQEIQDKLDYTNEIFYNRWYNSFISQFSSDQWAYSSIILFVLSLAFFGIYLFSKQINYKKLGFVVSIILLVISILTLIFARQNANNIINNNNAIVFDRCLIKASPSEQGQNLFEINKGLKVEIIDSISSWANIRLADGKQGWVKTEDIRKL